MKLPPRVSLAHRPTPLHPLDRLSERWGGPRIWIKRDDLTGSGLSGNKVRKLEFVLQDALERGAKTVATCGGLQSNHCRATALACARLGLRCVLYLRTERPEAPDGNHLLAQLAGAEVRFVTREQYDALDGSGEPYWIPEGASNALGLWGYAAASKEFDGHEFSALYHAVGSGGTTAGLLAGHALLQQPTKLVGVAVCNDAAYFYDKIDHMLDAARVRWKSLRKVPAVRDGVEIRDGFQGAGYAKNRPAEWALLREITATEGIVLDPVYTIKAMMALRQAIRDGHHTADDNVCFLHTGGLYGLFPRRAEAI